MPFTAQCFPRFVGTVNATESLNVVTRHNAPEEVALKARVEAVVDRYQLGKWLYTKDIRIDKDVWPPHSHPVLTLGVRKAMPDDDLYLIGSLLHEQFHCDESSTYNDVLVCYMEYKALAGIFGEAAALTAIKSHPFYTDIYALIADKQNQEVIEDLLRQEELSF